MRNNAWKFIERKEKKNINRYTCIYVINNGYLYIHKNTHTHTYIYIYTYIHIHITEVKASVLLENLHLLFPRYYIHSDVFRFKSINQ